jgi:large subunit ribosomal protein L30
MLRIKLVKSTIGNVPRNRATVAALGLKKTQQTVEHADTPTIRGMIHKVKHLLQVEEVEGKPAAKTTKKATRAAAEKPVNTPKPKVKASRPAKAEAAAPVEEAKPKRTTKKASTEEEK